MKDFIRGVKEGVAKPAAKKLKDLTVLEFLAILAICIVITLIRSY